MSERITRLKDTVQKTTYAACPERPLLWTQYFRNKNNRKKPMPIQIAEALQHLFLNKTVRIYPEELIVGNFCSKRVAGFTYPELAGVGTIAEIFKMKNRKVNPLQTTLKERLKLFATLPFWATRNLGYQAFDTLRERLDFFKGQLSAHEYQIYEFGGISHLAPDHEKLLRLGTSGIVREIEALEQKTDNLVKLEFYAAAKTAMNALAEFGERYADCAEQMAASETDAQRKDELLQIAQNCRNVPRNGATSFYEAVQSMTFAHIAIYQESLGESLCPGRIDQFLYPYYEKDLAAGRITREQTKEILSAFSIKLCETIPMFSQVQTDTLGGLTSYEVVTVGGVDSEGKDATNELSYILLEVMDELRMRQPNFHVRIHKDSPKAFYDEVIRVNIGPGSAPAMYNDEIIIETMVENGYSLEDARNYVAIGCVEPTSQGKTLGSTDAAMFNTPLALELALNEGKPFGSNRQLGTKTPAVAKMQSMDDVLAAYDTQVNHQLDKLFRELRAIERAHTKYHPTPLTSSLLDGCIEKGICSTQGGATYNFSGIQGCGLSTVADSLCAIEQAVFANPIISLAELVQQLQDNIPDEKLHARLRGLPKFGNDLPEADKWMLYVGNHYSDAITARGKNTRGGQYLAGVYSNTSHTHFGSLLGATANGRRRGAPYASGFAPENGSDKRGSTALLNSMNRMDFKKFANGINFNIKLDASSFKCDSGQNALASMFRVYFDRMGMQVQANMLDPNMLIEARDNPELHPNLLIRVSGYSAYFNDLSPQMQEEVISRSLNAA